MNDLIIEATQYTPSISMLVSGEISIKGKSYPENTFEFYQPVMSWLKKYFEEDTQSNLKVVFEIIYFNSSSSKLFFDFFDVLNENMTSSNISVVWQYDVDNEAALEAGEDFIEDFPEMNIQLLPY